MSVGYSNRIWQCPFFRWDERGKIHCEGGKVALPRREQDGYAQRYCASLPGWEECPLAQALVKYYERRQQNEEKREQGRKAGR